MNRDRVSITLQCDCPVDAHSELLDFNRAVLVSQSHRLYQLLRDPSTRRLSVTDFNNGYGCRIVDRVLRAWKLPEFMRLEFLRRHFEPSRNPLAFKNLVELARFLYDYQCSVAPFAQIALEIRNNRALFENDVVDNKNAMEWAFISLVFGWEEDFSRTVLGVPCLGLPDPVQSADGQGQRLDLHERALREAFPMNFVLVAREKACSTLDTQLRRFRQKDARRSDQKAAKALAEMLRSEHNFVLELRNNDNNNVVLWLNEEFFREWSVADLYRICFRFLEARNSKKHISPPRFRGLGRTPTGDSSAAPGTEPMALLLALQGAYDDEVRKFFRSPWGLRLRTSELFNTTRRTHLLVDVWAVPDNGGINPNAAGGFGTVVVPQGRAPTPPEFEGDPGPSAGRGGFGRPPDPVAHEMPARAFVNTQLSPRPNNNLLPFMDGRPHR